MDDTVTVCADIDEVSDAAAARFVAACAESTAASDAFNVALSGGTTPRRTYARLADPTVRDQIHWPAVHVFWGDERCVPLDHPDMHYRMATDLLLAKVPLPPANVHRVRGEAQNPSGAAADYEDVLRAQLPIGPGGWPRLDFVFLGMGADGHTASLFPGTEGCQERQRLAVAHHVPRLGTNRITLTLPVFNAAREVIFLVSGNEKAAALAEVLSGRSVLPAAQINPVAGTVRWIVDEAAAAHLSLTQREASSR